MQIKSIRQCKNLRNKTVLVRCDFDVPLTRRGTTRKNGNTERRGNFIVQDDARLRTCLLTIKFLLKKKVKKIILIGHAGRPAGKKVNSLSLKPLAKYLEKLLPIINYHACQSLPARSQVCIADGALAGRQLPITFINIDHYLSKKITKKVQNNKSQIILLENLRFSDREEANCQRFAKNLASLADIYINESFAASHRAHASIAAIQNYLSSYAGLHLEQEIKSLSAILKKPRKPLVLIIGGAKIETKLPVIKNFLNKANYILVGGAVANNFLKAQGVKIGKSLIDKKYVGEAKKILDNFQFSIFNFQTNPKSNSVAAGQNAKLQLEIKNYNLFKNYKISAKGGSASGGKNSKIILPIDYKIANGKILDIGSKTTQLYDYIIKKARTIIWNGPLGFFEDKKFAQGTLKIAEQILANKKAQIIIGGGETEEVIKMSNVKCQMSNVFISTGGGAMLEFLAGKKLPGLKTIISP